MASSPSDSDVRETLREVDELEDVDVTSWEADFIESVVYHSAGDMSDKERRKSIEIIRRYLDEDYCDDEVDD